MSTLAHPRSEVPTERGEALAQVLGSYPELGTVDEHIAYAASLADLGVHVAVLPPGAKKPLSDYRTDAERAEDADAGSTKRGWYLGTTDPQRLTDYITRCVAVTGRLPNLGMHLGPSGVVLVDCDNEGDAVEWSYHQYHRNSALGVYDTRSPFTVLSPGQFQAGAWVHRDGAHCWYVTDAAPDTLKPTSEKIVLGAVAEDNRAGWEIKCGYGLGAALPPSVRAEGAYVFSSRHIPVAPAWLLELLAKPVAVPRELDDSEDAVEFRESVDDALAGVSWTEVMHGVAYFDGEDSDGCEIWTRYGGSPRSMIVHHGCASVNGANCVTVHSDTILAQYPLPVKSTGKSFTKWEALAAFQFGGDMNAVAREYGFSRPSAPPSGWSSVFVSRDLPFGMSREWTGQTDDDSDLCPHGAVEKSCPPCMAARIGGKGR